MVFWRTVVDDVCRMFLNASTNLIIAIGVRRCRHSNQRLARGCDGVGRVMVVVMVMMVVMRQLGHSQASQRMQRTLFTVFGTNSCATTTLNTTLVGHGCCGCGCPGHTLFLHQLCHYGLHGLCRLYTINMSINLISVRNTRKILT